MIQLKFESKKRLQKLTSNQLSQLKIVMLLDNPFVSDARVEKEALALIKAGAAVTVVCTKEEDLPTLDERKGISIHRILGTDFNSPLRFSYRSFIQTQVNLILNYEFDVLHCHDFHMLALGAAVKKKKKSIKLIYDAHEYLIGWPFYQSSEKWKNRLKGRVVWNYLIRKEKENIRQVDAVLTVTKGISERLKKNNDLATLPIIVGNYPENMSISPNKSYFHQKYNLKEETKIIIHSGTIYHTEEQLNELFKIMISLSDTVLVFIGNRPRFYEIKEKVEKDTILNRHIFFHDYFSNQQKNINLIASGDFGIMHIRDRWLAHKITFSNRFVEYLMAGIPVVATPQEFTEEINSKYKCCTFYNENDFIQQKKSILEMIENLETFSNEAVLAKSKLDWIEESKKIIKMYSDLNI